MKKEKKTDKGIFKINFYEFWEKLFWIKQI